MPSTRQNSAARCATMLKSMGIGWEYERFPCDQRVLQGFQERNSFASVLLKGLSCLQHAARLLRDRNATDVEVSALVRDVGVVEFDDFGGRPVMPRVGAGADNDLEYATRS